MSEYKPKEELVGTTPENIQWGEVYPNWIITDTRFPNELQAVKDKGGINIRVNRPKERELILRNATSIIDTRKTLEPEHKSETVLDNAEFDYTIENDGTLDELIDKIRDLLVILDLI